MLERMRKITVKKKRKKKEKLKGAKFQKDVQTRTCEGQWRGCVHGVETCPKFM
jgi:hypothetical protein